MALLGQNPLLLLYKVDKKGKKITGTDIPIPITTTVQGKSLGFGIFQGTRSIANDIDADVPVAQPEDKEDIVPEPIISPVKDSLSLTIQATQIQGKIGIVDIIFGAFQVFMAMDNVGQMIQGISGLTEEEKKEDDLKKKAEEGSWRVSYFSAKDILLDGVVSSLTKGYDSDTSLVSVSIMLEAVSKAVAKKKSFTDGNIKIWDVSKSPAPPIVP